MLASASLLGRVPAGDHAGTFVGEADLAVPPAEQGVPGGPGQGQGVGVLAFAVILDCAGVVRVMAGVDYDELRHVLHPHAMVCMG
ncbi:MAG TPA: hypothetical protein VD969_28670 [Symbiobacteriaceae bacterium]|nr:hypothetical protein [Symbiobacteriaceae bacterium]